MFNPEISAMRITIDLNDSKASTWPENNWRPGDSSKPFARIPTHADLVELAKANGTYDPKADAAYLRNQVADARSHVGFDHDWSRAVLARADELDPPAAVDPDKPC